MKKIVTGLMTLIMAIVAMPTDVSGQATDVTIRQINTIDADSIAALNALGDALTGADITPKIFNALNGTEVSFVAVVLSDASNSGLSTPDATTGNPSRVHVFVRDTSAASQGNDGNTIQIVDGSWETNGTANLIKGDVIEVVGTVSPFFDTMQITPTSINPIGDIAANGLPASILDPVVVTTADINSAAGTGMSQANWTNFNTYVGEYVRFESVSILQRDVSSARPNWNFSSDGGATQVNVYDTSIRYRNDRANQNSTTFNPRTDEFVPPPAGAVVNLQGFLVYNNDDPFNLGLPAGAIFKVNPWTDMDLEILESAPLISNVSRPDGIPGADPVTITADVVPSGSRTLTAVELLYTTTSIPDPVTVPGTLDSGVTWTFDIPAAASGDFVTYFIRATDSASSVAESNPESYKVQIGAITSIATIQETADGNPGDSPFADAFADMDITATVNTDPADWGFVAIQDDAGLAPWSGIFVDDDDFDAAVAVGDVVVIDSATVAENFGLTVLRDVVFSISSSGTPLDYKVVPTSAVSDPAVAEAHEGMNLRFENVTIVNNDTGFGEWSFSNDNPPDNAIEADDASNNIASDFSVTTFANDDVVEFIQGAWYYSFGEFKLVPAKVSDIGGINVSTEDEIPAGYALDQNYPNPFNPSTSISYSLGKPGLVTIGVYDVLGREVAQLVSENKTAGQHTVTFNATNLSSGIYVYRLETGDLTINKSMILLK